MFHSPRCRVDPSKPEAAAICDRCGFQYNHPTLEFQYDFRGNDLMDLRILVCPQCLDEPQQQLRPRILPPDPMPVLNARPPAWLAQEGPPPPAIPVYQLIEGDD